jgi:hypothetical protein
MDFRNFVAVAGFFALTDFGRQFSTGLRPRFRRQPLSEIARQKPRRPTMKGICAGDCPYPYYLLSISNEVRPATKVHTVRMSGARRYD